MIDTIVLQSPYLNHLIASKIHDLSVIKSSIDVSNGDLQYKIVTSQLPGTYDSSIRVRLMHERLVSEYDANTKKTLTYYIASEPYIIIECSLHKLVLGHNAFGGSDNLIIQVDYLINLLNKAYDIILPDTSNFIVKRIDYAKAFKLDSNSINVFFKGLNSATYPRRRVLKYDDTGIYFPGFYTTLKFYDKGVEFKKHDKKRLQKHLKPNEVLEIEEKANNVLRIEVEIKSKKLKSIYEKFPTVNEININDLIEQWEVEVMRVLKVSDKNRKLYNQMNDVQRVLFSTYSDAHVLLGTWYRLCTQDYNEVKNSMSKSTFYRHVKKLKDVGVIWNHTDVQVEKTNIIHYDFNPLNTDIELIEDDIIKKLKYA